MVAPSACTKSCQERQVIRNTQRDEVCVARTRGGGTPELVQAVIVANGCGYTQGPFWLPWRIALVGQENQIEDVRFLFSPLTTPLVVANTTLSPQRC